MMPTAATTAFIRILHRNDLGRVKSAVLCYNEAKESKTGGSNSTPILGRLDCFASAYISTLDLDSLYDSLKTLNP
jgi:hypothetical protein